MLLKVTEAATALNASESFVYQAIKEGRLRCHRLGKGRGGIRISEEQLMAFLKESEAEPSSAPIPLKDIKHRSASAS